MMTKRRKRFFVAGIVLASLAGGYGLFHLLRPIDEEVRLARIEMKLRATLDRLVGLAKKDVLVELGEPGERRRAELPTTPFWGPQEKLTSILKPGQSYEEWRHKKGRFTCLIWFAGTADSASSRDDWKVVATGIHREGVVY